METTSPKELIKKLKLTMTEAGVDYDKIITELGQVTASEKRLRGEEFTLNDHTRALIFAQLSNQRPWGPIASNSEKIKSIFYDFDAEELLGANPKELQQNLTKIRCGNRSIGKQLEYLGCNISQFKKIIQDFGSLDKFTTSKTGEEIAKQLSDYKSKYKLKQVGFALAMEYLKNVGIRGVKPDVHILRICGNERLSIFSDSLSPKEITLKFNEFAKSTEENVTYLDNLFWIFGAKDYANICSAKPKCFKCYLRENCNLEKKDSI